MASLKRYALAVLACAVCSLPMVFAGDPNITRPAENTNDVVDSKGATKLMGGRFLSLATVVRVRQIETTRDQAEGPDESRVHSVSEARLFRETIDKALPGARITWAFSWLALKDQRQNYRELRELIVQYHRKYGDEVTFIPSGYFANMYNTREQVNRDLHDGLQMVSEMVGGGYRPLCVIAGFLAADTATHFDDGFQRNGFGWVTTIWELVLVEGRKIYGYGGRNGMDGLERWLSEIRRRWPDAKCITHGEFGMLWREQFKNNDSLDYRFVQRGTGFPGSEPEKEIRWFMNKNFRLALLRDWKVEGSEKVIDFTRYDLPAREPDDPRPGTHMRNWSLMNRLNQKALRKEDAPLSFAEMTAEEQMLIRKRYPELR